MQEPEFKDKSLFPSPKTQTPWLFVQISQAVGAGRATATKPSMKGIVWGEREIWCPRKWKKKKADLLLSVLTTEVAQGR